MNAQPSEGLFIFPSDGLFDFACRQTQLCIESSGAEGGLKEGQFGMCCSHIHILTSISVSSLSKYKRPCFEVHNKLAEQLVTT